MDFLRVAGAQLNLVVGDLEGNHDRIASAMAWAENEQADILLLPDVRERVELYRTIAIRLPDFTTVSLYFGLGLTRFFVGLRHRCCILVLAHIQIPYEFLAIAWPSGILLIMGI